jgi:pSer/pThr/pTyr-binding forkhead associated (FHA) protein
MAGKAATQRARVRYRRCTSCGTSNPAGAAACAGCGKPFDDTLISASSRSRLLAAATGPGAPPSPSGPRPRPSSPKQPAQGALTAGDVALEIKASLTEVRPDGAAGETRELHGEVFIGRENCQINYPDDAQLSPLHASVAIREGRLFLKDYGSRNGTFLRQRRDTELAPGDVFLLGRDLFRFMTQPLDARPNQASGLGARLLKRTPNPQPGPMTARLEHIELDGRVTGEFALEKPEITIGRTRGDLTFNDDPYMSAAHARVVAQPARFVLQDLNSRNGVYRRIRDEVELKDGDEFFVGEHVFRVQIKALQN